MKETQYSDLHYMIYFSLCVCIYICVCVVLCFFHYLGRLLFMTKLFLHPNAIAQWPVSFFLTKFWLLCLSSWRYSLRLHSASFSTLLSPLIFPISCKLQFLKFFVFTLCDKARYGQFYLLSLSTWFLFCFVFGELFSECMERF